MRWFLIALLAAGSVAAQTTAMYRTIASDGTVTYTDVPLNDSSVRIDVLVRSGTAAAQTASSNTPSTAATAPPRSATDQQAAEIAANCTRAREQQQGLQNSTRLYRVLADGGREFLTDEEVVAARESAANEVARWCESG